MKQVVKWTAEGAGKCEDHKVFCDVAGRRNLPGICGYPAKRTGHAVNQGGTADKNFYSSLTESIFLSGTFFYVIRFFGGAANENYARFSGSKKD